MEILNNYTFTDNKIANTLTHWPQELFVKNVFFGHFGGFQAGFRPTEL